MSTETAATPAVSAPAGRTRLRRTLTVLGATATALAVWALAGPVAGIDLAVKGGDGAAQPVGPGAVAGASLLAGLAGWALLAVLERILRRAGRTWTIVAVAVLALSLAGPLGGAADSGSRATLASLHLIVAAVLIPGLGWARRA